MLIPFLNLIFKADKIQANAEKVEFGFLNLKNYLDYMLNTRLLHYIHQTDDGKAKALLFICMLTVLIFFLKNIFRYLAVHFLAPVRTGVTSNIRHMLYEKMLFADIGYFSDKRKGDIMTRLTNDVQEVEYGILHFIEVAFKEPVTILATLTAMLIMCPTLTLFVLVVLPVSGYFIGRIGKSLKQSSSQAQQLQGTINAMVEETISGLRIIKSFTAEKLFLNRFSSANKQHNQITTSMIRRRDLSTPLSEFLGICVVVVVLYVGGRMVINNTSALSAEAFITFIVIFSQIIQPAKAFSNAFYFIQKGLASLARIENVLYTQNTIADCTISKHLTSFSNAIEFKDVSFSYDDTEVLSNINLRIEKGKKIALVGISGSGKSTLIQLLLRYFDVTSGEICIDGINIKELPQNELRALTGLVTQHTTLFNDSVENNITLGKQGTENDILHAAQQAHADEFICRLPQKYQSNIGDNGSKLSGGEQQRLTIARAIYKNAPILILDEATSHLDSNSEKLVQDALQHLLENRTAIIIAHRLSTVLFADEIVVLKQGKIIERGTHTELIASNGEYRKLVDLQQL